MMNIKEGGGQRYGLILGHYFGIYIGGKTERTLVRKVVSARDSNRLSSNCESERLPLCYSL
jgi:hypothetical protein